MRFWFDTEFIESGPYKPIQLISIGMVSEDGRELYLQSSEFCPSDASDWVRKNVIAQLDPHGEYHSLKDMRTLILDFVWPHRNTNPDSISPRLRDESIQKPEFWAYYADYDWVVFCQIFGTMMDLPKGFPMWCRDIKQLCADKGDPTLPEQSSGEHNALADARWNKVAWEFLQTCA